jgi:hypothetical protein
LSTFSTLRWGSAAPCAPPIPILIFRTELQSLNLMFLLGREVAS